MANTINVPVQSGWQLVHSASGARSSGVFSIGGGGEYCEQDTLPPAALIGHVFTGAIIPFELDAGQNIYVKTYRGSDTVIVTED
ncbi:hypothetical protein VPHD63_0007 [Vibrio phage D63]